MKTTFDKNAEKIVALMVEKIEAMSDNWQKPWFYKAKFFPQNLSGRLYSGGNAFLLYFLCEKYDYQTPIFVTFNQAKKEGVCINKGEVAFPVYYVMFCAYNRTTNEKLSLEEYNMLSLQEKELYRLVSYTQYYRVFNLDQTNFASKYPQKWEQLRNRFCGSYMEKVEKEMYSNLILDMMNENQSWVCPIHFKYSGEAFYSVTNDSITLPLKSQFVNGESFYSTELHEMGHSTGIISRLNRKGFYEQCEKSYGREELVAELIAAFMGIYLGVSVAIKAENVAYLKGWCKRIKESPQYLYSVLADATKGAKFISNVLGISLDSTDVEVKEDVA